MDTMAVGTTLAMLKRLSGIGGKCGTRNSANLRIESRLSFFFGVIIERNQLIAFNCTLYLGCRIPKCGNGKISASNRCSSFSQQANERVSA